MPQLDRLLSLMVSQRATALKLHESELAELEIAGAPRPMTKTALTGQQVVALLREIAPADAAMLLDAGMPTQFDYVSGGGAVCAEAARDGTRSHAPRRGPGSAPPPPPRRPRRPPPWRPRQLPLLPPRPHRRPRRPPRWRCT